MNPIDIKNLLPDANHINFDKIKAEHPYTILSKYAQAIGEKYANKLQGIVTESTDTTSENLLSYALYIVAEIGNGYSYRLLEIKPLSAEMYPLELLQDSERMYGPIVIQTSEELEKELQSVFRSPFTQNLILNLLARVEFSQKMKKAS